MKNLDFIYMQIRRLDRLEREREKELNTVETFSDLSTCHVCADFNPYRPRQI